MRRLKDKLGSVVRWLFGNLAVICARSRQRNDKKVKGAVGPSGFLKTITEQLCSLHLSIVFIISRLPLFRFA